MALKKIAVFCSVSTGSEPEYMNAARGIGEALAKRGITLVYGGGGNGMAGALVRAALGAGGQVIGVMPRFLVEEGKALTSLKTCALPKTFTNIKP